MRDGRAVRQNARRDPPTDFRRALGLPFKPWRAVALALATIPLGAATSALAQLAALVVPLWICLTIELVREPRPAEATAG